MRVSRIALLHAAAAGMVAAAGCLPAMATCGSANCFLFTHDQQGLPPRGTLEVDLSFRYVDQSRKLSGSESIGEVLTPAVDFENRTLEPDHHREVRTQNTLLQLGLAYGVTERVALVGLLPFFNQRDHEHFDGVGTPDEHFTREDGSSGFGDVQLGARYALRVRSSELLRGGLRLSLPTGAHRLRNSEGEINEPTIQPGSGAVALIGELDFVRGLGSGKLEWFASGSYRLNRENDLDYRLGDETVLGLGLDRPLGERFAWSFQIDGRRTARDEYLGQPVPSTGATLIDASPGLRLVTSSGSSLYGYVQVPLHQHVNEAQLAPRTALLVGVRKAF